MAKCKFKSFVDQYEATVERVFDKGAEALLNVNDKYDPLNLLTNSRAQKQLHEVIKSFEIESNKIYNSANELKAQLDKMDKADGENIVRALNGDIDPFELSDNHRAVYDKFRSVIDANAQALVDAGALSETSKMDDYLKRYYKEHLDRKSGIGRMFFDKRFNKRKNLTYDERIALGMIEDASFVIPQTIAEQRAQLLKANTLQVVAEKFASAEEFEGSVKVPNNTVGGGVYKYGALAGKYVRQDIFDAVNDAQLAGDVMNGFARGWYKLIDHIKVNVTVKNPVTHLYNIGSNVMLAGLNGDLTHLAQVMYMAANDPKGFDALLSQANEYGLNSHRDDFEGVDAVMDDGRPNVLKSLYKNLYMTQNSKTGKAVRKLYDWEDKIFKLASFKRHLEAGREPLEAYNMASEVYVDYSTPLPAAVKAVDKSGVLPFLHYVYKSTPATAKVIAKNPVKYMVMQSAIMALGASALFDENEDDYKPEWGKDQANLFGVKEWVNLGNGWYLNAGRMIPAMKFGGLDFSLDTGLGFVGGAVNIVQGKTPLGYDLAGKYDSDVEKLFKKALALAENYLPPLTFGRYAQRTVHIGLGEADVVEPKKNYYDEDMSVGELAGRAVGVRRFNEQKEIQTKATAANSERKFKNKKTDSKDYKTKRITEKDYKARIEKLKKSARKKGLKMVDKAKSSDTSKPNIKPKFKL